MFAFFSCTRRPLNVHLLYYLIFFYARYSSSLEHEKKKSYFSEIALPLMDLGRHPNLESCNLAVWHLFHLSFYDSIDRWSAKASTTKVAGVSDKNKQQKMAKISEKPLTAKRRGNAKSWTLSSSFGPEFTTKSSLHHASIFAF